jgi:hypothetical protein
MDPNATPSLKSALFASTMAWPDQQHCHTSDLLGRKFKHTRTHSTPTHRGLRGPRPAWTQAPRHRRSRLQAPWRHHGPAAATTTPSPRSAIAGGHQAWRGTHVTAGVATGVIIRRRTSDIHVSCAVYALVEEEVRQRAQDLALLHLTEWRRRHDVNVIFTPRGAFYMGNHE